MAGIECYFFGGEGVEGLTSLPHTRLKLSL